MSRRMLSRAQLVLTCLAMTVLCSCSDRTTDSPAKSQSDSEPVAAMMEMPTAAHFATPDGGSVVIEPGNYAVAFEGLSLKLVPEGSELETLIAVETLLHDEQVDEPTAAAYAGVTDEDRDIIEIALLMSDGTYFSAMGSISGVSPRGMLDRQKNRQAMRQDNRANRAEGRETRQANRDKPGINIGENLANRQEVLQGNRENRQVTREENQDDRRDQFGIGGNTIPAYRAGNNAFDSFDYAANGQSMKNTYLLAYLATLIYPDYLVEVDPNFRSPGVCVGADDAPCKVRINAMHKKGNNNFNDSNIEFLNNFSALTRQLFGGPSEYTWFHGYENRAIVRDGRSNLNYDPEAMVISTPRAVFVVFRGTDVLDGAGGWEEWLSTNINAAPEDPGLGLPGKVQYGFWNSLQAPAKAYRLLGNGSIPVETDFTGEFRQRLFQQVRDYGGGSKPVFITGHSLGGAHTQLFAAFLKKKGIEAQGVYAFESPQVGNALFARFLNETFGSRLQRFDFKTDPVTRLPMRFARPGARVFARNVNSVTFDAHESRAGAPPVVAAVIAGESLCFHYPHWGLVAAYNQLSPDVQNMMPSHLGTPWTAPLKRSGQEGFLACNVANIRAGNGM